MKAFGMRYGMLSETINLTNKNPLTMEPKTILTNDIEQLRDALCEAIEWVGQVADERYEHPIVVQLQEAIDLLDSISL